MLDITDSTTSITTFLQILSSVHVHPVLLVLIVLLGAFMVVKFWSMELLRVKHKKNRFYHAYKPSGYQVPLSRQLSPIMEPTTVPTTATVEVSASQSLPSVSSSYRTPNASDLQENASVATTVKKRCEKCRIFEKSLRVARASLERARRANHGDWSTSTAKRTLERYEEFIQQVFVDFGAMRTEKDVLALHVQNMQRAFDNLNARFEKARETISGLERNEKKLLSILGRYEMVFQLISDRTRQYQKNNKEVKPADIEQVKETLAEVSSVKDKAYTVLPSMRYTRTVDDKQVEATGEEDDLACSK